MCGIAGGLALRGGIIDPDSVEKMIRQARSSRAGRRGRVRRRARRPGARPAQHHRPRRRPAADDQRGWHLRITFNGEIFNYVELRDELDGARPPLRHRRIPKSSCTPTRRGARCVEVQRPVGVCYLGRAPQPLFLSRDRMGVRPLFYTVAGRSFALRVGDQEPVPASRGVAVSSISAASTRRSRSGRRSRRDTPFQGVRQLPPGHSMTVEAGSTRIERYWTPEYSTRTAAVAVRGDRGRAARAAASMRRASGCASDVPVGAYLSGGLDSTIVTEPAQATDDRPPLKTFSVVVRRCRNSTRAPISRTWCGSWKRSTATCAVRTTTSAAVFPDVDLARRDSRSCERRRRRCSCCPQLVRRHGYKVVLTGEGADEMFGGYDMFKEAKIRRFWARSRIRG